MSQTPTLFKVHHVVHRSSYFFSFFESQVQMSICLFIENILYGLFSDYGSPNPYQLILIAVIFVLFKLC